jgi:acetylornithine deacetylase/succinyl-diaminopimelate desuccinylase-like protein
MSNGLITRRGLLGTALTGAAAACASAAPRPVAAADRHAVYDQVEGRHAEAVQRLQAWIRQPSIAAENLGMNEGCDLLMRMLSDAGFQRVERIPTDGQPGVFATLDAGARHTVGLYFMYDVKQVDPKEWSSPPWDAALVDVPKLGKVVMGRGAVNQKGPQSALLAALHAFKGAGRKPPVNLVLVAEGEEEIGSIHFPQIVRTPAAQAALARCVGVFMPSASQGLDGVVTISLGAKGVIELELVSSGEKWGRGPKKDIHSGNRARVDSPAFHLVQALATLVTPDGDPAIDGFADAARPLDAAHLAMIDVAARRMDEATAKESSGVSRWTHDASWRQSIEDLCSKPTVNIQGLVGGYTGPGGKTVLPHKAVAKMDLRLVPDMTPQDVIPKLKAHLAKRGFGDLEVNVGGAYEPNTTAPDAPFIKAQMAVYQRSGIDPILWPRGAGSWPGYVFTGKPLSLPAGHFGVGHGLRAHAPDEYFLVESADPKLLGYDRAVRSFVDYLYELA